MEELEEEQYAYFVYLYEKHLKIIFHMPSYNFLALTRRKSVYPIFGN